LSPGKTVEYSHNDSVLFSVLWRFVSFGACCEPALKKECLVHNKLNRVPMLEIDIFNDRFYILPTTMLILDIFTSEESILRDRGSETK
jgi:hypothetical protein